MTNHPGHASETRRQLGIAPDELRAVIGVISHEKVFGHGPTRADLERFLGVAPKGYRMIALGWLTSRAIGPVAGQRLTRWNSTELARRELDL